jgi:hypothetical protein
MCFGKTYNLSFGNITHKINTLLTDAREKLEFEGGRIFQLLIHIPPLIISLGVGRL